MLLEFSCKSLNRMGSYPSWRKTTLKWVICPKSFNMYDNLRSPVYNISKKNLFCKKNVLKMQHFSNASKFVLCEISRLVIRLLGSILGKSDGLC